MPELPDLTVYAENLARKVTGKRITGADFFLSGNRLNVSARELAEALVSRSFTGVRRAGKEICFDLSGGDCICIHLMLAGGFVLASEKEAAALPAPVLSVSFADGSVLAVTDPKGLTRVTLNPKPEAKAVDALDITAEELRSIFRAKPRMQAKGFLLDQRLVGGIGNAYSDEILWRARIAPQSVVGKLPPEAIDSLTESIHAVLNEATEYLRKRHPDMISGEFREFLKVHNPSLKQSPTGAPIIKQQLSSKKTYYTEEQKLYK